MLHSTCTDKLKLTVGDKFLECGLRCCALQGPPHLQPLEGNKVSEMLLQRERQTKITFISLQMKRRAGLAVRASVTVERMWVTLVLK
jgi:hypothetical protein